MTTREHDGRAAPLPQQPGISELSTNFATAYSNFIVPLRQAAYYSPEFRDY